MSSQNASRFINAYNQIDHMLRIMYGFKTNITFSDLVRRCSSLNTVIRVYEDDLIDFARLRNAIIHNKSETIIAEPNSDVVELLEKIARLVATPPLAIDVIKGGEVDIAPCSFTLKDLILETNRVKHSSLPIYKGDTLIGVIRWRKFVEVMAGIITEARSVDQFIEKTTAEEFLQKYPSNNHYVVASNKITIEEALTFFNKNRKLTSIILTRDGTFTTKPIGIITGGDVMDLMKILENY